LLRYWWWNKLFLYCYQAQLRIL